MEQQTVLTGTAIRCSSLGDLTVLLGGYEGIIPREDAVHPAISGAQREIAVLSRVGLPVSFTITQLNDDGGGKPHLTLSRRAAQQQAIAWLLENVSPGSILSARVTHLEHFGAFVDLGVHQDGLVHISQISDTFIRHPREVLKVGDVVRVKVLSVDTAKKRIALTMKGL